MVSTNEPVLRNYRPSERRAILVHRYYLGVERGCEPSLPEAVESWEDGHADRWRSEKMRHDAAEQVREIEAHRCHMSEQRGNEVDFRTAAKDWVSRFEPLWREHWESTPLAGA